MREMTAAHAKFAALLDQTPWLRAYWDFDTGEPGCDIERLQTDMGVWSHGERIMAQFMAAVWFGENRLQFDLIDAAGTLDAKNRALIAAWINRPIWP